MKRGRTVFLISMFMAMVACTCTARYLGSSEAQLQYSDAVVRGVIDSVWASHIQKGDYAPNSVDPDLPFPMTELRIRVDEVLRGSRDMQEELYVVAPGGFPAGVVDTSHVAYSVFGRSFDYAVGQETVVCLWRSSSIKGGVYVVAPDEGRFVKRGHGWINEATRGEHPLSEIREVVKTSDMTSLLSEADVVASGTITEIEAQIEDPGGRIYDRVVMSIDHSWKGSFHAEDTMRFEITQRGPYVIPNPALEVGEEWLVFLKQEGGDLKSFAGLNGLLRLSDEGLIRNNTVRYERPLNEVRRILSGREQ